MFFFLAGGSAPITGSTMSKRTRANKDPNKYAELHRLVRPHVDSFNYFVEEGIQQAVADLDPVEVTSSDGKSLTCILYNFRIWRSIFFFYYYFQFIFLDRSNPVWIEECTIGVPSKKTLDEKLFPNEVCDIISLDPDRKYICADRDFFTL